MTAQTNAERLAELFGESAMLHTEWMKINVTKTGRLRMRITPEQFERSEEICKRSNAISKQICQLTDETYNALSA